ncbi:MAG TPA: PhoH family protein, partial [Telluria sp.]
SVDVVRHPLVARIVDAYETAASIDDLVALQKPATKNVRKK